MGGAFDQNSKLGSSSDRNTVTESDRTRNVDIAITPTHQLCHGRIGDDSGSPGASSPSGTVLTQSENGDPDDPYFRRPSASAFHENFDIKNPSFSRLSCTSRHSFLNGLSVADSVNDSQSNTPTSKLSTNSLSASSNAYHGPWQVNKNDLDLWANRGVKFQLCQTQL